MVLGSLGLTLVMPSSLAHANPPSLFGWWSSSNTGAVPVSIPSDVPTGGFEVTEASAVHAYAAVGQFTEGADVSALTFDLAPNTASVPTTALVACPLTNQNPFNPQLGGPIADAPAYNCAKPIPGVLSSDGKRIKFTVAGLARDGYLGVAIVVSGNGRQVFTRPTDDSVTLGASSEPEPTGDPEPSDGDLPTEPQTGVAEPPPLGSVGGPPIGPPVTLDPMTSPQPAPQLAGSPSTPVSDVRPELVAVTTSAPTIGIGKTVIGAAIIALLALGTWSKNRELAQAAEAGAVDLPSDPALES